ncbi:hypothetical protein SDC9_111130 [bioreactor metagenome]|uniref:Cell division protein FtsL n=1 Tax=bioreactor metagenome TaxID=1076179 RepID=A0A645BQZ3_9ZZZZ
MEATAGKKRYSAYNATAYAPGYDGTAARRLVQEEVLRPLPKVSPRHVEHARPRVRVRQQEKVSVFAVVGFLAVGIFAALVLMSYVNLTTAGDEAVKLRGQLSALQTEEAKLLAKYELTYDLKTLEETMTAAGMVKPQSGQIYTIDLSEPDGVVRYQKESPTAGAAGAVNGLREVFLTIVEYFR